jgi:hypothetical protein
MVEAESVAVLSSQRASLEIYGLAKRRRLQVVAPYIKNGAPALSPERLRATARGRMFDLGVEAHDDILDGCVRLL